MLCRTISLIFFFRKNFVAVEYTITQNTCIPSIVHMCVHLYSVQSFQSDKLSPHLTNVCGNKKRIFREKTRLEWLNFVLFFVFFSFVSWTTFFLLKASAIFSFCEPIWDCFFSFLSVFICMAFDYFACALIFYFIFLFHLIFLD